MPHQTHHLDGRCQGCGFQDPDHSYEGGRIQLNGGALRRVAALGAERQLRRSATTSRPTSSSCGQAAPDWTTFDRYFSAIMAETYPNRFYLHCAQTDRLHNGD